MSDPDGHGTQAAVVGEAYAAARELLRRAEDDAGRIRTEADRYVQQRRQEAELIVAKARRLLAIAEERAAAITAGTLPLAVPAVDAAPSPVADATIDLTSVEEVRDEDPPAGLRRPRTALDSILASAVGRAIDRALPAEG